MQKDYVFRIRNLTRRFNNRVVISVPELDIERGKFIFLLGNSGCGKSTFLETLGLMSQAYDNSGIKSQIVFYPEPGSVGYDYDYIWLREDKLNRVRLNYMSFLFQQTNLFPQFKVGQNISLSKVMQGVPMDDENLEKETKHLMGELGILAHYDDYPKVLSGGQQQRTAFARAKLKNFKILFADEPTGNLGEKDAETVVSHVRSLIDGNNGQHTAIIVTHDIDLALEYADSLIIMSQDGYVDRNNIFSSIKNEKRRKWPDLGNSTNEIKQKVQSIMDKTYGDEVKNKLDAEYIQVDYDYPNIPKGYDKEFKKFYHKIKFKDLSLKNITGLVLVTVLFVVWLAIGFSKGSLDYLEEKMSDPFINWITVVVPSAKRDNIPTIMDSLKSARIAKKYFVDKVSGFNRFALFFLNENRGASFASFGRNIDVDDPILEKILAPENLIIGTRFKSDRDYGLIVTDDFLNRFLKEGSEKEFVKLSYDMDKVEYFLPIPVRAIVNNLPGKSDFISTSFFRHQRFFDRANPFNPSHTKELIVYTPDKDKGWVLYDSLRSFFSKNIQQYKDVNPFVARPMPYSESFKNGSTVHVSFTNNLSVEEIQKIYKRFNSSKQKTPFPVTQLYTYKFGNDEVLQEYDQISLNVSSLDKVGELKDYLLKNFGLEIDMARIESLRNYNFIAKLTNILSLAIIIISILSVSIFVSYLLYVHLYKNRIYIGSFTAFGITDGTMQFIYLKRMTILVASALGISLVFAIIIGYSGLLSKFLQAFILMEGEKTYFNLINWYPIIFLLFLSLTSYFSLYRTAKYFLDHSPGDLIYDRIGSDRTSPPVHVQLREIEKEEKSFFERFREFFNKPK